MRIVLQGNMTPKQLGEAVKEIVENTLAKAEAEGKKYVLNNTVVETNLNIKGSPEPMLLIDDEKKSMFAVHSGIEKGELTPYVEPDRKELVDKFNRMVDDGIAELEALETEQVEGTA